ncbi:MAG: threonylcarbamoyl-AMP synthase [Deltaproteobacteria bacterium]|nr:threonylcarbamoyl-AMP synthase [Deltaproteobacteria bacterium]
MSALEQALDALRRGEVVAAPTETLVGLLADAMDVDAVARVADLKGRSANQPIALLLPDVAALDRVAVRVSETTRALGEAHWPGPLTLLVEARPELSPLLTRDGKVGVRVPGPSLALDLVRAFGGPLTATSANLSGEPAVADTAALAPAIAAGAHVLSGRAPGGEPSTFVDATVEPPVVLRAGAIDVGF